MKKTLKKIGKTLLIIVVALLVAAGGGYGYLRYTTAQAAASTLASLKTAQLSTGNINSTISATGTVRTQQTANVTWQASGKVGTIAVKVGDTVKANQVLASLDASSLPNNIITAQEDLVTAQQALADLKNNQSALPTAEQTVLTDQTAVDTAQKARDNLNYARGTPAQIAAAEASYLLAQQKVNQLQAIYNNTPGTPTTDSRKALALSNLEAAKTSLASALYNMEWIQSKPTAADIASADNALALAKANLADAQAALARLKNGPDAASLASAEQRIAADQATINTQYIYAPFDGTVTSVSNMTGDIVSSGTAAFRIDDTSAYYIDLSVSEVDIASVKVGQSAAITFDAITGKTYTGAVTSVGQVGSTSSGVVNFTVTVKITDPDNQIKPGLTASCDVVVSSAQGVLVVPSVAIKTVNNQKYVYILTTANLVAPSGNANTSQTTGNTSSTANASSASSTVQQIVSVQVTVGLSDSSHTQVTSSQLKVGDLIITNPTSLTSTTLSTVSSNSNNLLGSLFGGLLGGGGGMISGGGPAGGGAPPSGAGSPPSGSPPSGGSAPSSGSSAPSSGG